MNDYPTKKRFLALAAGVVAGYLSIDVSPLLLGAVTEGLGLGSDAAGLVTTAEFVTFGVSSIVMSMVPGLSRRRRLAFAAAVGVGASHLASALAPGYWTLIAARVLAGITQGVLIATVYAMISRVESSQRVFARCLAVMIAVAALTYVLVAPVAERFSHRGAYALVGALILLFAPMTLALPRLAPPGPRAVGSRGNGRLAAVLLLLGIPVITFSDGLVWPFAERIGSHIGLDAQTIGVILGASFLAGLIGSAAADRLGTRIGYSAPIVLGTVATACAGLIIAHATAPVAFATGTFLKNITIFFLVPYLLGAAARLDSGGGAAAASGGIIPLGFGAGPYVSGLILSRWPFGAIGWAGLVAAALGLLVMTAALVDRRLRRSPG